MYMIVRCPKCGLPQVYAPYKMDRSKWQKKCVRCGCTFKIYPKRDYARILGMFPTLKEAKEFLKNLISEVSKK